MLAPGWPSVFGFRVEDGLMSKQWAEVPSDGHQSREFLRCIILLKKVSSILLMEWLILILPIFEVGHFRNSLVGYIYPFLNLTQSLNNAINHNWTHLGYADILVCLPFITQSIRASPDARLLDRTRPNARHCTEIFLPCVLTTRQPPHVSVRASTNGTERNIINLARPAIPLCVLLLPTSHGCAHMTGKGWLWFW